MCPVHSPEGELSGLVKQLSITAIVSKEQSTYELIKQIKELTSIDADYQLTENEQKNAQYCGV